MAPKIQRCIACYVFMLLVIFFAPPVSSQTSSQSFAANSTLPANEYRALRLNGVPAEASILIELRIEGPTAVILLTESEEAKFPEAARPVATMKGTGDITLTSRAPVAGSYFVVIDNRGNRTHKDFAVSVTVSID